MRSYFLITFLSLSVFGFGQEDEGKITTDTNKSKFRTRSISFMAPLGFYLEDATGGGAFEIDGTFEYGNHLFTLMGGYGESYDLFAPSNSFKQVNVFYGRELRITRTIYLEGHAGTGYFSYKALSGGFFTVVSEDVNEATVGLPIMGKLRIHTGPRFSIGLKFGVNINSVQTIKTFGISLQWNNSKW